MLSPKQLVLASSIFIVEFSAPAGEREEADGCAALRGQTQPSLVENLLLGCRMVEQALKSQWKVGGHTGTSAQLVPSIYRSIHPSTHPSSENGCSQIWE